MHPFRVSSFLLVLVPGYNTGMKYSLRSLIIVVTLVASSYSDWLRENHAPENLSPHLRRQRALLDLDEEWNRFHEQSAIAYERVSKMPWLPVSLPTPPPQTPP